MLKVQKIISLVLLGLIFACSTSDATDPNDSQFDDKDNNNPATGGGASNADITLSVDAADAVDIYPDIFGVNNDWRQNTR